MELEAARKEKEKKYETDEKYARHFFPFSYTENVRVICWQFCSRTEQKRKQTPIAAQGNLLIFSFAHSFEPVIEQLFNKSSRRHFLSLACTTVLEFRSHAMEY